MQGEIKKARDPYFDNLKGILIFLVAAGHCLNICRDANPVCDYLFHLIYTFHMPLFFYISGYFSKNVAKSSRTAFEALIIPAIPFELLYYIMHVATGADNTEPFLTPVFAYWFCFALFFCRMLLPYLTRIRCIVPLTFVLALAAGFNPQINEYMTLSRFICMLPFFLLGYYTGRETMEKIRGTRMLPAIAMGAAAAAAVFALMRFTGADLGFTLRSPYENVYGMFFRAAQFTLALPLSLMVMRLTPAKGSYLSVIGQKTLQIYFLHFYFTTAIDMLSPLPDGSPLNCVLMPAAAAVITLLLSSGPVSRVYDAIVNAVRKILLKEGEV